MSNLDAKTAAVHYAMKGIVKRYPSGRKLASVPRETEAQAMSVVLAQRAKLGLEADLDDKMLESALGRFKIQHKLRNEVFGAGVQYFRVVHDSRVARGLLSSGFEPSSGAVEMTDEEKAEEVLRTTIRMNNARAELVSVSYKCMVACEKMILEEKNPSIYDTAMIINGLFKLSLHFSLLKTFHPT